FENYQFIYEGLDLAVKQAVDTGLSSRGILMSYWDFVDEDTVQQVFPDGFLGWDIEHGGVLETSLMLHLHPESVEMDRVIDHPPAQLTSYDIFPKTRRAPRLVDAYLQQLTPAQKRGVCFWMLFVVRYLRRSPKN